MKPVLLPVSSNLALQFECLFGYKFKLHVCIIELDFKLGYHLF